MIVHIKVSPGVINVVVCFSESAFRLWSTWDLKPIREITFPKSNKPIIRYVSCSADYFPALPPMTMTSSPVVLSLTYSCDGHHLYTANSDGTVMAWCRRDQQRMKLPMFYSFLSSYAAG